MAVSGFTTIVVNPDNCPAVGEPPGFVFLTVRICCAILWARINVFINNLKGTKMDGIVVVSIIAFFFIGLAIWALTGEEKSVPLGIACLFIAFLLECIVCLEASRLRNPGGIEVFPQGETVKVLAVDTSGSKYVNVVTVDSDKDIRTYALIKENFTGRVPIKGDSLILVEIDGKQKFILK